MFVGLFSTRVGPNVVAAASRGLFFFSAGVPSRGRAQNVVFKNVVLFSCGQRVSGVCSLWNMEVLK